MSERHLVEERKRQKAEYDKIYRSKRYIPKSLSHSYPDLYEAQLEKNRQWRALNEDKYRLQHRRNERRRKLKRYGLTEESYQALLVKQNYVCAICKEDKKGIRDWHVDHCHSTGRVRGILCHHCNLLLGNAKDSVSILLKAKEYLDKCVI